MTTSAVPPAEHHQRGQPGRRRCGASSWGAVASPAETAVGSDCGAAASAAGAACDDAATGTAHHVGDLDAGQRAAASCSRAAGSTERSMARDADRVVAGAGLLVQHQVEDVLAQGLEQLLAGGVDDGLDDLVLKRRRRRRQRRERPGSRTRSRPASSSSWVLTASRMASVALSRSTGTWVFGAGWVGRLTSDDLGAGHVEGQLRVGDGGVARRRRRVAGGAATPRRRRGCRSGRCRRAGVPSRPSARRGRRPGSASWLQRGVGLAMPGPCAESGSTTASLLKSRLPKFRPTGSPGLRQLRAADLGDRAAVAGEAGAGGGAAGAAGRRGGRLLGEHAAVEELWPCIIEIGGEASPVFFSPVPSLVAVTLPVPCSLPAMETVTALAPAWEIGAAATAGAAAIAPSVTAPITDAKRRYERIEKVPPQE